MKNDLPVWFHPSDLAPLHFKQVPTRKANRTLQQAGVRLPNAVPAFQTEIGRDAAVLWLDRYQGDYRLNAVVRGPHGWERVSAVELGRDDSSKYYLHSMRRSLVTTFRDDILRVSQGECPSLNYAEQESRLEYALTYLENPSRRQVYFVDYTLLMTRRIDRARIHRPIHKVREDRPVLILQERARTKDFLFTYVPVLIFDTQLYFQQLAHLQELDLIGGIDDNGTKYVVVDGAYVPRTD